MTQTRLDLAHAHMEAAPSDDAARLSFFERLAESELFVLLESEPQGDQVRPRIFPADGGQYVLVFDRAERLAEFAQAQAPYAAMSGRAVVAMLQGHGVGLGVNLGVAPSSILLPQEAVDWLAQMVAQRPSQVQASPDEISPPGDLPQTVLEGLDKKLATAEGLAATAYLANVRYQTGAESHILAFIDAVPGAEPALAAAVNEVLAFSGLEAAALDVAFFRASDTVAASFARVGLRFDLPKPQAAAAPTAPGRNPDKPPRLR